MKMVVINIRAERRGFTLIELMLVLALIGAVWGLSTPVFRARYERLLLADAVDSFREALLRARLEAILKRVPARVEVDALAGRWRTSWWAAEEKVFKPFGGAGRNGAVPRRFRFAASAPAVTFYPDGTAENFWADVQSPAGGGLRRLSVSPLTGLPHENDEE